MNYLALGDSMSIDRYTGVPGGGAASQFAGMISTQVFQDLTHDGNTTDAVIESLQEINIQPDIITLTAGGNDLLQRQQWNIDRSSVGDPDVEKTLANLQQIARHLKAYHCLVVMNTVYDPTDGDDGLLNQLGMSPSFRSFYNDVNKGIRSIALEHGFVLSDLEGLFRGHGISSEDTWITMEIEPNHAGATAIAQHWYGLIN